MSKIALIVPNNLWVSPYLSIYTRLFDEIGVKYDTISWNREGRIEDGIQFNYRENSRSPIAVLWSYIKYARFLKKIIRKNGYEKLVIFTPQVGLFLIPFLEKYYKGKYIFDYRDLSLEQKSIFRNRFRRVLDFSYANVISSPGFKKYLPKNYNYIISHNFNVEIVKKAISTEIKPYEGNVLSILTIGALRTDMNPQVMDALGGVAGFKLSFVGKGISAEYLESYAKEKGYKNVVFTGYYKKDDEPDIYEVHSMVNIVYPLIPSHISAISNRFYNSLIYKRPMIVSKNTAQGDYAQQYKVGLVVDTCENLRKAITDYINKFDYQIYSTRCNDLLIKFLGDYETFRKCVIKFVG